jgi:preprotein translocase subunit SecB
MKNSFQIRLNRYFFTKVLVAANPAYNPEGNRFGSHVKEHVSISKAQENPSIFFGELKVSVPLDEGENPPYEIDVGVFGVVEVVGEGEEDAISKKAQIVLTQTLSGATREMVQIITSRGPWPGFVLPIFPPADPQPKKPPTAPRKKPGMAPRKSSRS